MGPEGLRYAFLLKKVPKGTGCLWLAWLWVYLAGMCWGITVSLIQPSSHPISTPPVNTTCSLFSKESDFPKKSHSQPWATGLAPLGYGGPCWCSFHYTSCLSGLQEGLIALWGAEGRGSVHPGKKASTASHVARSISCGTWLGNAASSSFWALLDPKLLLDQE